MDANSTTNDDRVNRVFIDEYYVVPSTAFSGSPISVRKQTTALPWGNPEDKCAETNSCCTNSSQCLTIPYYAGTAALDEKLGQLTLSQDRCYVSVAGLNKKAFRGADSLVTPNTFFSFALFTMDSSLTPKIYWQVNDNIAEWTVSTMDSKTVPFNSKLMIPTSATTAAARHATIPRAVVHGRTSWNDQAVTSSDESKPWVGTLYYITGETAKPSLYSLIFSTTYNDGFTQLGNMAHPMAMDARGTVGTNGFCYSTDAVNPPSFNQHLLSVWSLTKGAIRYWGDYEAKRGNNPSIVSRATFGNRITGTDIQVTGSYISGGTTFLKTSKNLGFVVGSKFVITFGGLSPIVGATASSLLSGSGTLYTVSAIDPNPPYGFATSTNLSILTNLTLTGATAGSPATATISGSSFLTIGTPFNFPSDSTVYYACTNNTATLTWSTSHTCATPATTLPVSTFSIAAYPRMPPTIMPVTYFKSFTGITTTGNVSTFSSPHGLSVGMKFAVKDAGGVLPTGFFYYVCPGSTTTTLQVSTIQNCNTVTNFASSTTLSYFDTRSPPNSVLAPVIVSGKKSALVTVGSWHGLGVGDTFAFTSVGSTTYDASAIYGVSPNAKYTVCTVPSYNTLTFSPTGCRAVGGSSSSLPSMTLAMSLTYSTTKTTYGSSTITTFSSHGFAIGSSFTFVSTGHLAYEDYSGGSLVRTAFVSTQLYAVCSAPTSTTFTFAKFADLIYDNTCTSSITCGSFYCTADKLITVYKNSSSAAQATIRAASTIDLTAMGYVSSDDDGVISPGDLFTFSIVGTSGTSTVYASAFRDPSNALADTSTNYYVCTAPTTSVALTFVKASEIASGCVGAICCSDLTATTFNKGAGASTSTIILPFTKISTSTKSPTGVAITALTSASTKSTSVPRQSPTYGRCGVTSKTPSYSAESTSNQKVAWKCLNAVFDATTSAVVYSEHACDAVKTTSSTPYYGYPLFSRLDLPVTPSDTTPAASCPLGVGSITFPLDSSYAADYKAKAGASSLSLFSWGVEGARYTPKCFYQSQDQPRCTSPSTATTTGNPDACYSVYDTSVNRFVPCLPDPTSSVSCNQIPDSDAVVQAIPCYLQESTVRQSEFTNPSARSCVNTNYPSSYSSTQYR